MRRRIARFLLWLHRRLNKPTHPALRTVQEQAQIDTIRTQARLLNEAADREANYRADYIERACELIEARQMAGAGPWLVRESRASAAAGETHIKESNPITSQGAFGDIELSLQNVEWRREINLSWLEFSRWGIQQIILISRLYYIKNPLIRRIVDIAAAYVFGRGVEVSSDDDAANKVIQDFFEANRTTLGQIALVELEKRKYYDGNLFFAFFSDTADKGSVKVRNIDATEIQDIITDPDDSDKPHFYRREWVQRAFTEATGVVASTSQQVWYPSLVYAMEATSKPKTIGKIPVMWDTPVLHRKCGGVAKWHYGCPLVYPALDWAKEAKRFLEHCVSVKAALATIARTVTTKGGQQAIEGIKQQLQTSVGPVTTLWDQNPNPVAASTFVSGPGTEIKAFDMKGAGGDMNEVRPLIRMVCMCVGIPDTFMADTDIGQLATATSLDRPTELIFLEKQEAWREDLVTIAKYVLQVSKQAPSGKLRSSLDREKMSPDDIDHLEIREAPRRAGRTGLGNRVWLYEAKKNVKAAAAVQVRATFPAIREGDLKTLVDALVESATLGNKAGQVIGIDEKECVRKLYELNGYENADEMVELQYPDKEYDPDRTKQKVAPPIQKPTALAPGQPAVNPKAQAQPGQPAAGEPTAVQREMARRLVREAVAMESE